MIFNITSNKDYNLQEDITGTNRLFRGKEALRNFVTNDFTSLFPIDLCDIKISLKLRSKSLAELKTINYLPKKPYEYSVERNSKIVSDKLRLKALGGFDLKEIQQERQVVLFATPETIANLRKTIKSLNEGVKQGGYYFSLPEKFGIYLKVSDELIAESIEKYFDKLNIFIHSSEIKHSAMPIIYLPPNSNKYYQIKALLASFGRVSQILSHESLDIYGLWNLGTNLYAKFGGVPWGVSSFENNSADLFLGFSTSLLKYEDKSYRNIGYVNVFDRNGVWRFMQSSTDYIDFSKRLQLLPQILNNAIDGYLASNEPIEVIDIHYSKKFSRLEREKCFESIFAKVPTIKKINFISFNKNNPFMVFSDKFNDSVIRLSNSEFLLRLGNGDDTKILNIKIWTYPEEEVTSDEVSIICKRIKMLSKLNWRSAVKDTNDPVTLKYSEEIAQLANHFNFTEWKNINNQLSKLPWFI